MWEVALLGAGGGEGVEGKQHRGGEGVRSLHQLKHSNNQYYKTN